MHIIISQPVINYSYIFEYCSKVPCKIKSFHIKHIEMNNVILLEHISFNIMHAWDADMVL